MEESADKLRERAAALDREKEQKRQDLEARKTTLAAELQTVEGELADL